MTTHNATHRADSRIEKANRTLRRKMAGRSYKHAPRWVRRLWAVMGVLSIANVLGLGTMTAMGEQTDVAPAFLQVSCVQTHTTAILHDIVSCQGSKH